jgi:hypothetical protein
VSTTDTPRENEGEGEGEEKEQRKEKTSEENMANRERSRGLAFDTSTSKHSLDVFREWNVRWTFFGCFSDVFVCRTSVADVLTSVQTFTDV